MRHRLAPPLIVWIASVVILLGSLAPSFAQALGAGSSDGFWTEVCTSLGTQRVLIDEGSSPGPAEQADHALQHCPYCSLQVTDLALPPPRPVPLAILRLSFGAPEPFLAAPRTLFAWVSAQPRAPPLHS